MCAGDEPQERQGRVLSQWVPAPWSTRMNQCSGCLQLKQEVPCAVVFGQLKITRSFTEAPEKLRERRPGGTSCPPRAWAERALCPRASALEILSMSLFPSFGERHCFCKGHCQICSPWSGSLPGGAVCPSCSSWEGEVGTPGLSDMREAPAGLVTQSWFLCREDSL